MYDTIKARVRDCSLGWAIFMADGSSLNENGDRPFQLQRVDEPEDGSEPLFDSDLDAHMHVARLASEGDRTARLALRYLRRYSLPEYIDVLAPDLVSH